MKRLVTVGALTVLACALLAPAPVAATVHTPVLQIEVTGRARILTGGGFYLDAAIQVPIKVRCPVGRTALVPIAGVPGYFPGNAFGEPGSGGSRMPNVLRCTGSWQASSTIAVSHGRFDYANPPALMFAPGPVVVAIQASLDDGTATARDTEQIKILRTRLPVG